jgi:hypothetical protein
VKLEHQYATVQQRAGFEIDGVKLRRKFISFSLEQTGSVGSKAVYRFEAEKVGRLKNVAPSPHYHHTHTRVLETTPRHAACSFVNNEHRDKGDDDDNEKIWNEMIAALPKDQHRFVVFDFHKNEGGRQIEKPILIKW